MIHYRKIDTPENYVFGKLSQQSGQPVRLSISEIDEGLFRVQGVSDRWPQGSGSIAGLAWRAGSSTAGSSGEAGADPVVQQNLADCHCDVDEEGSLKLILGSTTLLDGRGFGLCGSKWLFRFAWYEGRTKFYGLGGKNLGFELSGKRTLFWNTDLFAEFAWSEIAESRADPLYASFPVVIGRTDGLWWAVVMDNPCAGFMNLGAGEGIFNAGSTPFQKYLYFGSRNGAPDVWIIAETNPRRLVQKIQTLQGRFAVPPLWALGHHQCRWGYRSYADLNRIAGEYEQRKIPNDGLWLDIDYMDGFRVFTVNREHFTNPKEELQALKNRGFHVIPILDPGLRRDEEYPQYRDAAFQDILCKTREGREYIGFVWPGYTVFPDFSLEAARSWWAHEVMRFTELGFDGYWIDMNDPATGSVPLEDMRFDRGKKDHEWFHNQYALGMAMATRQGLEQARPGRRPFIISRSAYLGMSRYSGMWTGDNVSNAVHLAKSIPFSLNLSVSGMPFNGPDVPGFAGDADGSLMETWYKAGFLFPFLRNHNIAGARDQEPWTRGKATEKIVAEYIRSRYKLLPYLYQCWIAQEEIGDPVMRPLWYHWPDLEWALTCDTEFMIGSDILHAPILDPAAREREVRLPPGMWFDWIRGSFVAGNVINRVRPGRVQTPLYFRAGSVIPMLPGIRTTNEKDLSQIDLLILAQDGQYGTWRYCADDGETLEYRDGKRSELELSYRVDGA
ncbi:MAG: glycoside hydrolase family 31 protein, partial [Termitinemataceae bacterium]